jgi:hypothetical protein
MAQSAARRSHKPKVMSSSLIAGKLFLAVGVDSDDVRKCSKLSFGTKKIVPSGCEHVLSMF